MLLRRVTQHIKSQNWFAVFIDFLIVVVGVFIGIQVSNWNAERVDRKTEQGILFRLSEDVSNLLNMQKQDLDLHVGRLMNLETANPVMFSLQPMRKLTDQECRGLSSSHWMPPTPDEMPSIDEIISAGNMSLITNAKVKSLLQAFVVQRQRARTRFAESTNELFRLSSRHPQLVFYIRERVKQEGISTTWLTTDDEYGFFAQCDIEKIRASKGFLNEYVDNMARLNTSVRYIKESISVLTELNAELELLLFEFKNDKLKQEPT